MSLAPLVPFVLANMLMLVLLNSAWRFSAHAALIAEHRNKRIAASITSLLTFLFTALTFNEVFLRYALHATTVIPASSAANARSLRGAFTALSEKVNVATTIANLGNPLPNLSNAPLWPLTLLVVLYIVRFGVYRLFQRRGRVHGDAEAATVLSHTSALIAILGFAVIVMGVGAMWATIIAFAVFFALCTGLLVVGDAVKVGGTVGKSSASVLGVGATFAVGGVTLVLGATRHVFRVLQRDYQRLVSDRIDTFTSTMNRRVSTWQASAQRWLDSVNVRLGNAGKNPPTPPDGTAS